MRVEFWEAMGWMMKENALCSGRRESKAQEVWQGPETLGGKAGCVSLMCSLKC